jgi:RNA polymerase sigma factor (sigma-70 family)
MSTLEYGIYTGPALTGDSLHRCLIDLQGATVRKHHFKLPALSLDEYEDLYGRAIVRLFEKHPNASFPAPQAVTAWLDTTIERAAIDQLRRRSLGRETNDVVSVSDPRNGKEDAVTVQPVDAGPTPEQHVLLDEQDLTLKEFVASLAPGRDQQVGLLHLHPGSQMKLKGIATALALPDAEINTILKRIGKRWSRYVALEVDEVCALRQRDLATWRRTGQMPAALRWHLKRCSTCRAKVQAARSEACHSLLPLVGAVGLPAGGGLGFFSKLYHGIGAHPLVIRAHDELSRVKKFGTFGAGGGGAIVTAKTVAATALVGTVAAAGAGVAVVQSISSSPPARTTPITSTVTTATTTTPATTSTPVVAVPPPVTTSTATITTSSKTSITPRQLSPLGVANPSPIGSTSTQSQSVTAKAARSQSALARKAATTMHKSPPSTSSTTPRNLTPLGQQSAAP